MPTGAGNRHPTQTLVATAAAWGLSTDLAPPRTPLPTEAWEPMLRKVAVTRTIGTLIAAMHAGEWPATDAQWAAAEETHRTWMGVAIRLERELVELGDRFDRVGVPFLVLKGSACAHLDYPAPEWRCFGDVDLLVDADHIERARALLLRTGGVRRFPEPRPGFDRTFSKGFAFEQLNGLEIDVHRSLTGGPFGLALDLDDLWQDSDSFRVGGRSFRALGRPRRFLHACYHALLGRTKPQLVPLRDVAQTAPIGTDELDAVLEVADRWRGTVVVAEAIRAASNELGWHPDRHLDAWAASYVGDRREQRWLSGYREHGRAYATLTGLEAIPGVRRRAAYTRAVLLPDRTRLQHSRTERWSRGLRSLRRSLAGPR